MNFYINTLPKNDKFRIVLLGEEDGYFIYTLMRDTEERANKMYEIYTKGEPWVGLGVHKLSYIPNTTSKTNEYEYEYRGFHIIMLENKNAPYGIEFGVIDQNNDEPIYHGNHIDLESALNYIDRWVWEN